jgi:hypothetical protein
MQGYAQEERCFWRCQQSLGWRTLNPETMGLTRNDGCFSAEISLFNSFHSSCLSNSGKQCSSRFDGEKWCKMLETHQIADLILHVSLTMFLNHSKVQICPDVSNPGLWYPGLHMFSPSWIDTWLFMMWFLHHGTTDPHDTRSQEGGEARQIQFHGHWQETPRMC